MRKLIFNNWGLKIASLFLASILWFLVVQIEDPKDYKTFNNIQVRVTGQELLVEGNKVFEVLDNSDIVTVTVRAPKSIISQMRASDIIAEADVSKLTDINTIAISYSVQNVDVDYTISGNHDFVKLNIEDKSSKWIKVTYGTVGNVADGYIVSSVTPDQTHIEVSGPKSVIDNISYAHVEIDVSDASSNLTANPEIVLYDKEDNRVEQKSVARNVDYVRMSVEVLATKTVPIEVNFSGEPEDGYLATGVVTCEPEEVMLAGSSNALYLINKIVIPEDRISIKDENSDVTSVINIREYLPDNIKLADAEFNGRVSATVYIEKLAEKRLQVPIENISVINIPDEYKAEIDWQEDEILLEIEGLSSDVSGIAGGTVRGTVDLQKWLEAGDITNIEGSHKIAIDWKLDNNIGVVNNSRVDVVITKK